MASAVKALAPSMPVILLTGWGGGSGLAAEGDMPPDVDRVLSKPPKLRELRETLAGLQPRVLRSDLAILRVIHAPPAIPDR